MKVFMKNKKGVTLVEAVFAVVILAILVVGIITLLTAGGTKILQISREANVNSEVTRKVDYLISAVSNGSAEYVTFTEGVEGAEGTCVLNTGKICSDFGITADKLTVTTVYHVAANGNLISNVRGWYVTINYPDAPVSCFLSNSEGVFDVK